MSKPATNPAAMVANDALDAIEYGRHLAKWLTAVMRSIQLDAQHNDGRNVETLASLGQYLGDDCAGHLSNEGERLAGELDAAQQVAADLDAALSAATARKRTPKEG